jgi:arylsulfatase A-like enzyme
MISTKKPLYIFCGLMFLVLIEMFGQPPDKRPNVIVILADDLGWADVGIDSPRIETPNLARLTRAGVRLTAFYSSATMCSPARAALLTGRYPHSVGMPDLASPVPRNNVPVLSLNHDAITIPEALKAHGYRSMLAGKWHLGHHSSNWPRTHGFDEFHGSLIGTPGYYDVKETYNNETPIKVEKYFTDDITDEAVDFIVRQKNNPFFLYLAYNAPHYPLEAPAELVYKYRMRYPQDGLYAIYAAMVERMDNGIGRVMDALDSLGISDNTLIVFTSDNGPSAEPRTYGLPGARISAGPLRDHKYSTHEGGIRVPFIARWPQKIPAGIVRHEPAIMMDIMPTLLEACDIGLSKGYEVHGTSILALLQNKPFKKERTLHWEDQYNFAVRQGEWKLVRRFFESQPRLYQITDDMGEHRDVAAEHREIVSELLAEHDRWRKEIYPKRIPAVEKRSMYIFPIQ